MHPGTRSRKTSRESGGKLFTITDKARIVAASKERWIGLKDSRNLARVAIDNAYFDTYKPRQVKSTVAQLVDLEEDMAKDDFDYSVFVKREDPAHWKVYKNELKEDLDKLEGFLRLKAEPVALWNERQAREKQARSPKCDESGLVGVWQVMQSLGVTPKLTMDDALNMSFFRKKDDTSPLPEYLMSCSRHGMTHHDILKAMETLSNGRIGGRFFEFYPQRRVDIRYWLAGWIKRGVVPLATLNYQKSVRSVTEEERSYLPKDWHHHMIYAVSYDGVHLSNPISKMKAEHFKQRIESESVVMISRDEVLGRLQGDMDYEQLKSYPEWRQMNVAGQIEVIEREEERFHSLNIPCGMKHIAIPSSMIGGITLFSHKDSENHKAIMSSEEVFLKI